MTRLCFGVGVSIAAIVLSAVWVMTTLAVASQPKRDPQLTIEVIGHQWWWEVRYLSDDPAKNFVTANEIHIPVGKRVAIKLKSADVIHSFWVPALAGKMDLIPGVTNVTWIEATKSGVYRGQCAEFCGLQHARMALLVVANEPAVFDAWLEAQIESAPPPKTESVRQGLSNFVQKCGICHTVRGTRAMGIVGPDLSHLMQRRTLAAATIPNRIGYLAGWISDPQHIKPGSFMPKPDVTPAQLQRILAFLQTLE